MGAVCPVAVVIISAMSADTPAIVGIWLQVINGDPVIVTGRIRHIGPVAPGILDLYRIILGAPYIIPMESSAVFRDIIGVATIRCRTIITKRGKGIWVAPRTVISIGAITSDTPFIAGAGIQVFHLVPGLVADAIDIIPAAARVTPLDMVS
jgi:hypothetical protein